MSLHSKDAQQLLSYPLFGLSPPHYNSLYLLSFELSRFPSSHVVLRLPASHRLPFMHIVSPRDGFQREDEQMWHSRIMFSFFSPVSLVVVTSLTSSLKFFISHFTFHVAHSHCLSLLRRMGSAGGIEVVKEAIYSMWTFQPSNSCVCARVYVCA